MDYSLSDAYAVDAGTGRRKHQDTAPVTTELSAKDANSIIWSLMEFLNRAGLSGIQFDAANPASYQRLRDALDVTYASNVFGSSTLANAVTALGPLTGAEGLLLHQFGGGDLGAIEPYWSIDRQTSHAGNALQGLAVDATRGYVYDLTAGAAVARYAYQAAGTLSSAATTANTAALGHQSINVEPATGKLVVCGPDEDGGNVVRCDWLAGAEPANVQVYKLFPTGQNGGPSTPSLSPDGTRLAVRATVDSTSQKIRVFDWTAVVAGGPGDYSARSDLCTEFTVPYGSGSGFFTQALMLTDHLVFLLQGWGGTDQANRLTAWSWPGGKLVMRNDRFNVGATEAVTIKGSWEVESLSSAVVGGKLTVFLGISYGDSGSRVSRVYKFGENAYVGYALPDPYVADKIIPGYDIRGYHKALADPYTGVRAGRQQHSTSQGGAAMLMGGWSSNENSEAAIIFMRSKSGAIEQQGACTNNTNLGSLQFYGSDGAAQVHGAYMLAEVQGDPAAGILPTRLSFATMNAAGLLSERHEISLGGVSRFVADAGVEASVRLDRPDTGYSAVFKRSGTNFGGIRTSTSYLQVVGINTDILLSKASNATDDPVALVQVQASDGAMFPGVDNAQTNGTASRRWSQFFAGTTSISSSDARIKADRNGVDLTSNLVSPLSTEELAASQQLALELGVYKFRAAVEEKGAAGARLHCGITVQRAMELLQANNLTPTDQAFICFDQWDEQRQPIVETMVVDVVQRQVGTREETGEPIFVDEPVYEDRPVLDDAGQPTFRVTQTAGDLYSLRSEELALFLIAGQAAEIASLKARLTALETSFNAGSN